MTIGGRTDDRSGSAHRELRLAELAALGLLVVEGLVILGYVAAAIANQAQFGGQHFNAVESHVWGFTLTYLSGWSLPPVVVVFLLGPLGIVAWIRQRGGDEISAARAGLVLRLEFVLAMLTVIGGIVSIVGRVIETSPAQQWSGFFETLGLGVGSVCLGVLGVVIVRWLADDMGVDVLGRQRADEPMDEERQ
jgi:hypothetical protein